MVTTRYVVTGLRVPTREDVTAGELLGVDVDGVDDACGSPDYEGSVDNLLIDIAAALPSLMPSDPFYFNAAIEAGLFCNSTEPGCASVRYEVAIERCGEVARLQLSRSGTTLGADIVELDGDGRFDARFELLSLDLPVLFQGAHTIQAMNLRRARVSGVVSEGALEELVIGGANRYEDYLPLVYCDPAICDPGGPIDALFDVMLDPGDASCGGISVGFVATAVMLSGDD
ncbi:MAG: hypothetical protein KC668_26085 [Myxococcales bacterium]|nr:hypothetical protein [Myxococcales bacterium]